MRDVRTAIRGFLDANAQAYDRLADQAFDDGLAQFAEEFGRKVDVHPNERAAVIRRLNTFHQPSLIRIHNELVALASTAEAPDAIDRWFTANEHRLEAAIGGILWSASEAGYAHAATVAGERLFWNLEDGVHHCWLCPLYASGGPYNATTLPAFPGDGSTPCGGRCHCYVTFGKRDPLADTSEN